jgi:hypothetical protein
VSDPAAAAPALWEWPREEFNALVRLSPTDVKPLQHRLLATDSPGERRALSILLSLNGALPAQVADWRPMQAYRCGAMKFDAFQAWALSRQGDTYALAFAKPGDRVSAVLSLRTLKKQTSQAGVDGVAGKEFLAELITYLEAGGLP